MDNRVKILIGFAALLAAVVIVVAVGGGGDDDEDSGGDSGGDATELEVEMLEEGAGPEAEGGRHPPDPLHRHAARRRDRVRLERRRQAPALPVTLGQGGVIPGFEQGLEGAKAGEKRKITIPSDLGYGAQGQPPTIPPDADLVFEIEVESIGAASGGGAPPQ